MDEQALDPNTYAVVKINDRGAWISIPAWHLNPHRRGRPDDRAAQERFTGKTAQARAEEQARTMNLSFAHGIQAAAQVRPELGQLMALRRELVKARQRIKELEMENERLEGEAQDLREQVPSEFQRELLEAVETHLTAEDVETVQEAVAKEQGMWSEAWEGLQEVKAAILKPRKDNNYIQR